MKVWEIRNSVLCNFAYYANSGCSLVSLPLCLPVLKGYLILNKMQTPFSHPFSFNWDLLFSCAIWMACEREGDRNREQRSLSCFCCPAWSGGRVGCQLGTDWIPGRLYRRKHSPYPKYINYFVFFSSKLPFSLAEMTKYWLGVWVKGREPAKMSESPRDKPKNRKQNCS